MMDQPLENTKRVKNSNTTRTAILNAAEAVFAEFGFKGARIQAIARAAGYNQGLIFRYFGNKLGLYAEVIRRADWTTSNEQSHLRAILPETTNDLDGETVQQQVSLFIDQLFDFFVSHPQIAHIYLWEMAGGWQTFAKVVAQEDQQDVEKNMPIIARINELGLLHREIPPLAQLLMVQ